MMLPISAIPLPTPQRIWTKTEFENWLTWVVDNAQHERKAYNVARMTDAETVEFVHSIVRNVTAEVPPAGCA